VTGVGQVVSLEEHRRRRGGDVGRLERAVARLDPAVRDHGAATMTPTLERELRAIARAATAGRHGEAADRAERLLGLLGHPAMSG
jgi:hypothetical protein